MCSGEYSVLGYLVAMGAMQCICVCPRGALGWQSDCHYTVHGPIQHYTSLSMVTSAMKWSDILIYNMSSDIPRHCARFTPAPVDIVSCFAASLPNMVVASSFAPGQPSSIVH
jgi:hypothetical protein